MNRWIFLAALAGAGLSMGGAEWTSKSLEKALPDGEKGKDESVSLRGKVVERDDEDEDGNAISRAFLEQDNGGLIPLPCERKKGDKSDKGLAATAAGKATAGLRGAEPSCWDYIGDKVKILGTVQSIHKEDEAHPSSREDYRHQPLGLVDMKRTGILLILSVSVAFSASFQGAHAQAQSSGSDADELSRQATDPTASLMAFNLINDFQTSYYGNEDSGYEFRFQPVIPFRAFGTSNILRTVIPFQGSGPGDEGLKSVSIFDLVVLPRSWGRIGIGPVMSLAESANEAPSKFSIGPAVGAVARMSRRLNLGAFNQNLFGSEVGLTQLQPIVAFQLGGGWALSAGDLQFIYDWERDQWVSIPIGFQIGVVRSIGGQPFRFSVNPQWNLKDITGANESKVVFTVALLAPAG